MSRFAGGTKQDGRTKPGRWPGRKPLDPANPTETARPPDAVLPSHDMPAPPPTPDLSPLAREIKKRRPFEQPAEEAYLNLVRTESVLTGEVERLFKRFGLSGPKYNVLRILRGAAATGEAAPDGLPSLEVASRLITRVPDVTRLVDSLEAAALVTRTRCTGDRRVVYVGITPAGTDLLARIDGPLAEHHRACFEQLGPAEVAELNRLLVKLRRCRESHAKAESD